MGKCALVQDVSKKQIKHRDWWTAAFFASLFRWPPNIPLFSFHTWNILILPLGGGEVKKTKNHPVTESSWKCILSGLWPVFSIKCIVIPHVFMICELKVKLSTNWLLGTGFWSSMWIVILSSGRVFFIHYSQWQYLKWVFWGWCPKDYVVFTVTHASLGSCHWGLGVNHKGLFFQIHGFFAITIF